jgi:uncharacterized protein
MDVRGCGKSGGEFRFLDRNEQKDLYDVIEWLDHRPWSNGKVGGIGQSYFCMLQWWMAIGKPPSLACIAAFDGLNDPYRASLYQGGMLVISSAAIGGIRTASSIAIRPMANTRASRLAI